MTCYRLAPTIWKRDMQLMTQTGVFFYVGSGVTRDRTFFAATVLAPNSNGDATARGLGATTLVVGWQSIARFHLKDG